VPSLFWKNFKIALFDIWHLMKNLTNSNTLCAGALSCWKTNSLEIWRVVGRNCCNSITSLNSMMTCVYHLWLADWFPVTERYLSPQAFCRDVFLVGWWICVQSVFRGIFGLAIVNKFSSVNNMMLTLFWWIFPGSALNSWVLHRSSLHSAQEHGDFWANIFYKVV